MTQTTDAFSTALTTGMDRIIACLEGLDADGINWKPPSPETNSLYVLAVHMMGTLEQTFLHLIGGEPDHRDRDAEFAAIGESSQQIYDRWATLKPKIQTILAGMSDDDLSRIYDHPRRGPMTGLELLIFFVGHTNEHVGHAELTRDMLKASVTDSGN